MKTINASNKTLGKYFDAIYGAINASNRADNETDGTTEKALELVTRDNRLFEVCKEFTDFCGLSNDGAVIPAKQLLNACNKRVTSWKAEKKKEDEKTDDKKEDEKTDNKKKTFQAVSGATFRKWVKEYMYEHMGVEFVAPVKEKKVKTERVNADELAAFRAWKAEQK